MTTLSSSGKRHPPPALFWSAALVFALLLIWVVLPGRSVGFTSDDLLDLVESTNMPWYAGANHLSRPIRNALFRLLPAIFGLNPLPYRVMSFVIYCAAVLLLYRFVRQIGRGPVSALAVTVLFAFFPRNHESLFWFDSIQDIVISTCILFACLAWLSYLRTRRLASFVAAHIAYLVALGFKETAIGLPVVLLCLELCTSPQFSSWRDLRWKLLKRYLLFIPIAAGLVTYAFWLATRPVHQTYYVGTFHVVLPLLRMFVNVILQFSLATRIVPPSIVALGCAVIAFAVWISTNRKLAWFGLCWLLIFALPPAAFSPLNGDRYLMLPYIGLLFIVAGALDRIDLFTGWPATAWQAALLAAALVYAVAGGLRLAHFREAYRQAADEISRLGDQAARLIDLPAVSSQAELVFVAMDPETEVNVLNNGIRGLLMTRGMSRQVPLAYTFIWPSAPDSENALLQSLESCATKRGPATDTRVLMRLDGDLVDVSGTCALKVVAADRHNRPRQWFGTHIPLTNR